MSDPKVEIYYTGVGEAMRLDGIRGALSERANGIAQAAGATAAGAGLPASFRVDESVREDGRPEAQVTSVGQIASEEDRNRLLTILREAGGGV